MHGERTKQIEEEEKKPRIELLHSTGLAMEQMNCVPDLLPGRGNKVSAA